MYEKRPQKILEKLQQFMRPLGYQLTIQQNNDDYTCHCRKGQNVIRGPRFVKDRRGRIFVKLKQKDDVVWEKCIDHDTDEWLAYYIYKRMI